MTLLDHFKEGIDNDIGEFRISAHGFSTALLLLADTDITRAQLVSKFNLNDTAGNDKDQLDELIANYQNQSGNTNKLKYIYKTEGVLINYEGGLLTEAQVKTFLVLT